MISRIKFINKILKLERFDRATNILIYFFLEGKGQYKKHYNHLHDFKELQKISRLKIPDYINNIEYLKNFINIKGYNLIIIKNKAYLYRNNDYIKPILVYDSNRIENSLLALAISI